MLTTSYTSLGGNVTDESATSAQFMPANIDKVSVATLGASVSSTLALNGGITKTHALTRGSPALTRRAGRRTGDCLEVEDLVLHCAKRHALRGGRALPLTEWEFLALETLVRAHGQPVSPGELLARLWHGKEAPRDNFVAVLMMRLRKKVDEGETVKLVRTVRGAGYVVGNAVG